MAVELSKYDGPVRRAFEILDFVRDAHAAGKSIEQIKREGKQFVQKFSDVHFPRGHCETESECEQCRNNCHEGYAEKNLEIELEFAEEAAECITGGLSIQLGA